MSGGYESLDMEKQSVLIKKNQVAVLAGITQVQRSLSLTPGWNVTSPFRMACNLGVHLDLMRRWQLWLDAFANIMCALC